MATIVIGGQASGVGKTSVICALMTSMPERRWTAIKVTQCSHQSGGKICDCDLGGRAFAIREECEADGLTDTSRYLVAGAEHALWVRMLPGHLSKVMPRIEEEIARAGNVVIESNSVMEYLRPDVYALVVSPEVADFKPSALKYMDRTDAILTATLRAGGEAEGEAGRDGLPGRPTSAPQFSMDTRMFSPAFIAFVRRRIGDPR